MVMVQIGGIQKFSTVDYPGHTCAAVFLIGCNMRCGYCHNPELVLPEQYIGCIPEAEILDFLARRVGLLDGVAISGGEPTMSEDLPDFIRAIKQLGFLVKLDTNGTHPVMLRQMLDEQLLDFVAMDIKGPLEKYVEIAARQLTPMRLWKVSTSFEAESITSFARRLCGGSLSQQTSMQSGRWCTVHSALPCSILLQVIRW